MSAITRGRAVSPADPDPLRRDASRGVGFRVPVRTCVGCRSKEPSSALLRLVAEVDSDHVTVVPDPLRRAPGRGAWIHLDEICLDSAVRRRAFARAFRGAGFVDVEAVRVMLHGVDATVLSHPIT